MPHSSFRPLFESLENRTLAAAQPGGDVATVEVTSVARPINISQKLESNTAIVNRSGTLLVRGTQRADSIRLYKVGQALQISITTNSGDPGEQCRMSARYVAHGNEQRLPVALSIVNGLETYTYTVPLSAVKRALIDGRAGSDQLKLAPGLPIPSESDIERTILLQIPAPAGQTPSDPAPGVYDHTQRNWNQRLLRQLSEQSAYRSSFAFFGDSHAERYLTFGRRSWNANFANAINLGTSGDSTRQLLYRLQAGLFDTYKPDKLVLMIGTNNFNDRTVGGTDAEIEAGIQKVISTLRAKLPDTQIAVVSILPHTPDGLNMRIQHVNLLTEAWSATQENVHFLNVFDHFVGNPVRHSLFNRDNHLNAAGYRLLTNYLVPLLRAI